MKTLLAGILLLALAAGTAGAVTDPQPDRIGVYFDPNADSFEIFTSASVPFFSYFILTNPTAPTLDGMEFHYELDLPAGAEGLIFRLAYFLPGDLICLTCGEEWGTLAGNVRLAGFSPLPTGVATVLLQFQYMLLSDVTGEFYLAATPFTGPDSGQLAYRSDGEWIPLTPSSGSPDIPVAYLNQSVLPADPASFGAVKALYR